MFHKLQITYTYYIPLTLVYQGGLHTTTCGFFWTANASVCHQKEHSKIDLFLEETLKIEIIVSTSDVMLTSFWCH